MIETDEDLPEPPAEDFWEGGAWDVRLSAYLIFTTNGAPLEITAQHIIES